MKASRVEQAARNNAGWCDTFCRLHGAPGEFLDEAWVTRHRAPAYYPNLVTLRQAHDQAAVLENVRALIGPTLPGRWAVKDSFKNLNLSELGFDKLFEASWIWHEASPQTTGAPTSDIRWAPVVSLEELQRWEAAWSKANGIDDPSRKFFPSLLADPSVAILAGYRGQQLIAGGIANSSDAVVGLSNVFAPPSLEALVWAGLLTSTQTVFPGKHVVGYEHGAGLEAARTCGFEEIGGLNVWLRRA